MGEMKTLGFGPKLLGLGFAFSGVYSDFVKGPILGKL